MPAVQPSEDLRALCHQHHLEMKLNGSFLSREGDGTQAIAYGCTEPDCHVHYNRSRGYFLLGQNGNSNEMDLVPKVRCLLDEAPMYLAEVNAERRDFRLWTCPQCGARRTNEDDLVGLASQGIQDLGGEGAPHSESQGILDWPFGVGLPTKPLDPDTLGNRSTSSKASKNSAQE
jgi:hypothetical protein